jgi:hypothetical protein
MIKASELTQVIFKSLEEINNSYRLEEPMEINEELALDPQAGILSSLDFVYFLVGVEEQLKLEHGISLSITDEVNQALSSEKEFLYSVKNFAEYLEKIVSHVNA